MVIPPLTGLARLFSTQSIGSTCLTVPTTLPPANPAQQVRDVAKVVSIIAASIVGGVGTASTAAWAIWNSYRKRADAAGRADVEVVEEQSAVVQSLAKASSKLRLSKDTLWLGNIGPDLDSSAEVEKNLLRGEAVDAGILTTEHVAQIDQVALPPQLGSLLENISTSDAPSAKDPSPMEPPSEMRPPQYDDPLSVRCADSLPPMGEYQTRVVRNGLEEYPVRVMPDAFKDLSFDAKIVYASSYGENVWSRTLIYSNGYEAAVGPDNQPLYRMAGLKLNRAGNVVSYLGIPVKDLETSGFSKSSSWKVQQAKLEKIRKAVSRTPRSLKADLVEQKRIELEQDRYKKNQARIRKLEEGREKLQKRREDKQLEQAKNTAEDKAQEKASQEERFRKLREDRQQAQAMTAAEKNAKEESDRERERLQTMRRDKQQSQDAVEKRGKTEAELKKEEVVGKIKEPYPYRKAKEEVRRKAKESGNRKVQGEADMKAREEVDRKPNEETDRRAQGESDRSAKEEPDRKAKEEAVRKAEEEALENDDPNAAKWKHKPPDVPDVLP